MGYVKNKGITSVMRLENGKLLIWYDKTMNSLINRAKKYEINKTWVI